MFWVKDQLFIICQKSQIIYISIIASVTDHLFETLTIHNFYTIMGMLRAPQIMKTLSNFNYYLCRTYFTFKKHIIEKTRYFQNLV